MSSVCEASRDRVPEKVDIRFMTFHKVKGKPIKIQVDKKRRKIMSNTSFSIFIFSDVHFLK